MEKNDKSDKRLDFGPRLSIIHVALVKQSQAIEIKSNTALLVCSLSYHGPKFQLLWKFWLSNILNSDTNPKTATLALNPEAQSQTLKDINTEGNFLNYYLLIASTMNTAYAADTVTSSIITTSRAIISPTTAIITTTH